MLTFQKTGNHVKNEDSTSEYNTKKQVRTYQINSNTRWNIHDSIFSGVNIRDKSNCTCVDQIELQILDRSQRIRLKAKDQNQNNRHSLAVVHRKVDKNECTAVVPDSATFTNSIHNLGKVVTSNDVCQMLVLVCHPYHQL